MTDKDIIKAAKEFEKTEGFCDLVRRSKGVNSAAGIGFIEGADWCRKQLINKACEWLERNTPFGVVSHERVWDMVQEFRKAMEEKQ